MLITLIFQLFFSTVIGVIWTSPQEIPIDFIHGSFSRPSRAGGRSQRRNAKWFCAFMGLEAQGKSCWAVWRSGKTDIRYYNGYYTGYTWICMDINGYSWILTDINGYIHGYERIFVDIHERKCMAGTVFFSDVAMTMPPSTPCCWCLRRWDNEDKWVLLQSLPLQGVAGTVVPTSTEERIAGGIRWRTYMS